MVSKFMEAIFSRREDRMLVLTRKTNETIQLGDSQITITVVNIGGGRVKLGIQAPTEIRIERLEKALKNPLTEVVCK